MYRFTIVISALCILLTSYGKLSAEYIFLKDGSIIECKILDETPNLLTVRVKHGRKEAFLRNNIIRVLYTKLYMGKVYIYKTSGKVLQAYIVDEDQENYIVRTNISKPEEFAIKRIDVLFIARKKAAGLEGKLSQNARYNKELPKDSSLDSKRFIRYFKITAKAGFLVPVGEFARFYDYGGGTALCISVDNLFYPGFGMGVESGYLYLHGSTNRSKYTSIIPFMADIIYRFQVRKYFVIEPKISLGMCYNTMNISKPLELYIKPYYIQKRMVEFMFSGGVSFSFIINKLVFLGIETDYSGIAEKSRLISFLSAHICAGIRL
jgi:hypothetical protein